MKDQALKNENSEMNFSQTADALKHLMLTQKQEKLTYSKLKVLFPYLKKHPVYIIIVILASIISAIVLLPVPILMQFIIDNYIKSQNVKMILIISAIIIGLYVFNFIIKIVLSYVFSLLNNKLLLSIKQDLTEKIISLPLSFFSETESGYLVSRINEINQLGSMFSMMFLSLIISVLTFVCSLFILGFLSWQILVLSLFFLPLQFLIVKKFTGGMQNVSKVMMEKSAQLNKNMQEMITGIQTVKSFATEGKEKIKINTSMHSVYQNSLLQNIFLGISQEIIGFVSNISNLLVLVVSALLIINNQLTIGLYVACLQYVGNLFRPVQAFASTGMVMQPMIVAITRIYEYFEILGEDNSEKRERNPSSFTGKVVFENIVFGYDNKKPILNDVSFSIKPGEKIAIRGANGSGKTTIIKLLLQLHLPHQGKIMIDNNDISTISLSTLRKKIGLVSQEVFLFNDSIKNNLTYGCSEFSKEELSVIIQKFCPFINELSNGINTMVGERGDKLSGGQKQAISIVRTILKKPDIFVFDEGSTYLDQETEMKIKELIDEYFYTKTCIFVSHNDSILNYVNRVLLIENTKIEELNNY